MDSTNLSQVPQSSPPDSTQDESGQAPEQNSESPEGKDKIKKIITLVILLLVIGLIIFYFLPKSPVIYDQLADYPSDFKVSNKNLPDEEIEKYLQSFIEIKQSLEDDPDYQDAWLRLGMVKKQIGDYQGAEVAWIKAGELSPKNSVSFGNLADLYANFTEEYDKAELAYLKAVENSLGERVNLVFYRSFYYFYYYNLEDYEKAPALLLEGIENNPNSSELPILLASFYKETGNINKAIQYYQLALKLDPTDELIAQELEKLK